MTGRGVRDGSEGAREWGRRDEGRGLCGWVWGGWWWQATRSCLALSSADTRGGCPSTSARGTCSHARPTCARPPPSRRRALHERRLLSGAVTRRVTRSSDAVCWAWPAQGTWCGTCPSRSRPPLRAGLAPAATTLRHTPLPTYSGAVASEARRRREAAIACRARAADSPRRARRCRRRRPTAASPSASRPSSTPPPAPLRRRVRPSAETSPWRRTRSCH